MPKITEQTNATTTQNFPHRPPRLNNCQWVVVAFNSQKIIVLSLSQRKNMTDHKGVEVSDAEMLKQIWDEIRYVRDRLDGHITDEDSSLKLMRRDITGIKEEISGHRVKLGMMITGVGLAMSGLVTWVIAKIGSIS